MTTLTVKFTGAAFYGIDEEGGRFKAVAGDIIDVSETQYEAYKDQMVIVSESDESDELVEFVEE